MKDKCYQLILCDEHRSPQSMSPDNASPLFPDNHHGRVRLWRYIWREWFDGAFILDENNLDIIRHVIMKGNPLDVNDLLIGAVVVDWEIV